MAKVAIVEKDPKTGKFIKSKKKKKRDKTKYCVLNMCRGVKFK